MTTYVLVELFKLRKRWMLWVMLVLLSLFLVLFHFVSYASFKLGAQRGAGPPDGLILPGSLDNALSAARGLVSLMLVILTASVVAGEYAWGTVRISLTRGVGRPRYLTAKLALLLLIAGAAILFVFWVSMAFSTVTTLGLTGGIDWDFLSFGFVGRALAAMGRTWATVAAPIFLTAMLAVLTRSSAAAIGVGIAYAVLEPTIAGAFGVLGGWGDDVARYTISYNTAAVTAWNSISGISPVDAFSFPGTPQSGLPNQWRSLAVLAGYSAAFLGVAYYVFGRRDVSASGSGD